MSLRKLKLKDRDGILEWMLDKEINQFFRFDPQQITVETVTEFIRASWNDSGNKHYAIEDEEGNYLGTISLKNINYEHANAELAIAIRKTCLGKGIAMAATAEILATAFHEMGLHRVYLNVLSDNKRAIRFYEKAGFLFEGRFIEHLYLKGEYKDIIWYGITQEQFEKVHNDSIITTVSKE